MARYIDADELYSRVKTKTNPYGKPTLDYESGVKVLDMIKNTPTADVVPKSEVDLYRKQVDELEDELASTYDKLENAKAEIEKLQNGLVIWKQNRFNLFQRLECYEMARQKVASEIFAEIEFDIHQLMFERDETRAIAIEGIIAELKKKYTE